MVSCEDDIQFVQELRLLQMSKEVPKKTIQTLQRFLKFSRLEALRVQGVIGLRIVPSKKIIIRLKLTTAQS